MIVIPRADLARAALAILPGPGARRYATIGEGLEDIARFVGHAKPSTTAGYVTRRGRRRETVARRTAELLDLTARRSSTTGVRNDPTSWEQRCEQRTGNRYRRGAAGAPAARP